MKEVKPSHLRDKRKTITGTELLRSLNNPENEIQSGQLINTLISEMGGIHEFARHAATLIKKKSGVAPTAKVKLMQMISHLVIQHTKSIDNQQANLDDMDTADIALVLRTFVKNKRGTNPDRVASQAFLDAAAASREKRKQRAEVERQRRMAKKENKLADPLETLRPEPERERQEVHGVADPGVVAPDAGGTPDLRAPAAADGVPSEHGQGATG